MYNITKLWKKPTRIRMVTFPNGQYGIERIKYNKKEYMSRYGSWYSDTHSVKESCSFEEAKDAAEQMAWVKKEFPDAVIKEY